MTINSRRAFLRKAASVGGAAAALSMFPPAIRKALAVTANNRTGTIKDVEHIVILMQENRSFDHYFGTLRGVRGFADRFPIPLPESAFMGKHNVWYQLNDSAAASPRVIAPFHLNTQQTFDYMRVSGTPHSWPNAQYAWNHGMLDKWPTYKQNHSMGYYTEADIPFQFALANAFTICDAYHCSFQGGTNPNRVYAWTGYNDPFQQGQGPVIGNSYDSLDHDPTGGYLWTTYPERLQAAGVTWQVYQNMDDNFTDNPLAGFRRYRDAYGAVRNSDPQLRERGLSTRDIDMLKDDVKNNKLPQVSFIVATAEGSEHPGPSSPAQGAAYTAAVLDALTSNTEVWSKTALFLMFDENDGFFDHVPPPAAPTYEQWDSDPRLAKLAGASTVSTDGEYHHLLSKESSEAPALMHRPYGLGPRVPMYVISPWSKGGWVNSQVFDHTSVIRFLEQRFGVMEPNITPWRRAVCGDLVSAFNFSNPDAAPFAGQLPDTKALAQRAKSLSATRTPPTPALPELPTQNSGTRPSRALPYELHVSARVHPETVQIELIFSNTGAAAAVFHVYDKMNLKQAPRRYTVEAGKDLRGSWALGDGLGKYDLWVLGPNGFHRHFVGDANASSPRMAPNPEIQVCYDIVNGAVTAKLHNTGSAVATFTVRANAYLKDAPWTVSVAANAEAEQTWQLCDCANWYDFSVQVQELPGYARRFAGRVETGKDTTSDPAMGGRALSVPA
ncbi:phosphocholine-specific phospholipase C [Janthinobacterium fluminis]|uniref:phospholipase C n=1 Tax=Janthinobacterium fluminis TaxID=2987524 RepID=A0ABT5JYX4_9BURK|nr:phospholipase C, phosphocholine-specific [Janthinobacterium fluminis]MDC8756732.1 phospholipase C, phosphocholine-specific [Janthinobacterium fluminis]